MNPSDTKHTYVAGYDPGGRAANGIAWLEVGAAPHYPVLACNSATAHSAKEAFACVNELPAILIAGIDGLAFWTSERACIRSAEVRLAQAVPAMRNAILSPNSLRGAMILNGLAAFQHFASRGAALCEVHPSVLFFAVTGRRRSQLNLAEIARHLSEWLQCEAKPASLHEADAFICAYAALQGLRGIWHKDLHRLTGEERASLVDPLQLADRAHFYWPG